jgi:uncharacterized membrane protein YeaQ/YmgE (transglycosylase-associated protein family)
MTLTVVLWLLSGAALVVLAWRAAPDTFSAGLASCLIAGIGGAFVGGELFVVLGGPVQRQPDLLTLLGSTAGALLCIDLVSRPPSTPFTGDGRLRVLWLSLQLWSPVMFAVALGVALGRASDSLLLAIITTVAVVIFLAAWHRHHVHAPSR